MKGLLAKLKTLDYKAFAIDHFEKIVMGFVGLFALLAVSPMMTDWSTYPQSPQEIISKSEKVEETIKTGASWAKNKKETPVISYMNRAHQLSHELLSNYSFSISLFVNLYPPKELIKEPTWLPIGDLIATQGVTILGMQPKVDPSLMVADNTTAGAAPPTTKPNEIGEFDIRLPGMTGTEPGGPGTMSPANSLVTGGPSTMVPGSATGPDGLPQQGLPFTARGARFVSVRGIYPVREQLENLRKAMNLTTIQEAYERLEVLDFTLERQTARPGKDPWSGKWEPVDMQAALDVLNESVGFADDPVDPAVTDISITSPLPPRLQGGWGEHAIHPKVIDFQLSPDEIKKIKAIEEAMVKNQKAVEEQMKRQQATQKKGFAGLQLNTRQMVGSTVSGRNSDSANKFLSTLNADSNLSGGGMNAPMTIDDLRRQFSTFGRVFLFRYIDFDVQPGYAYRYRVRLNIRNPNFELPEELLADKAVSLGPTRETPWSAPSNPAVVGKTNHFFLKEVERDPMDDLVAKVRNNKTIANFTLYLWDASRGTMLMDAIRTISLGQRINEKKKTEIWDVATMKNSPQEMLLGTDAWLIDATGDSKIDLNEHKDLNLPKDTKKVGLLNEALVLDDEGRLKVVDPMSQRDLEKAQKSRVEQERAGIEKLRAQMAKSVQPGADTMSTMGSGSETPAFPRLGPSARKLGAGGMAFNNQPGSSSSGNPGSGSPSGTPMAPARPNR